MNAQLAEDSQLTVHSRASTSSLCLGQHQPSLVVFYEADMAGP